MSWAPINLQNPVSSAASLAGQLGCVSINPWAPGVGLGSGLNSWLSFPAAVEAAVAKIEALNPEAVFVIGLGANSTQGLADMAGALSAALPLPEMDKIKRVAGAVATLAADRLTLPEPVIGGKKIDLAALPFVGDRVVKDLATAAKTAAADLLAADPLAELDSFETAKSAADALVDAALPDLTGGTGWQLFATGDFANQLRLGHPGFEASQAAIMVLTGTTSQLGYFNEMMA